MKSGVVWAIAIFAPMLPLAAAGAPGLKVTLGDTRGHLLADLERGLLWVGIGCEYSVRITRWSGFDQHPRKNKKGRGKGLKKSRWASDPLRGELLAEETLPPEGFGLGPDRQRIRLISNGRKAWIQISSSVLRSKQKAHVELEALDHPPCR